MICVIPLEGWPSSSSLSLQSFLKKTCIMDSQHIIYIFGRCLLLLHAIFSRSIVLVADAATDMGSTTIPPNFVPVMDSAAGVTPADPFKILTAPDAKGQICTLASLGATVVIWPEGDESRQVRIEMPDKDVAVSTDQNCYAGNNPSSLKPILVVTWLSSFQLCFYISQDEEKWTVNNIVFAFNITGELIVFGSEANTLTELQAPLGISYRCWASKKFPLLPLGGGAVVAGLNKNNSYQQNGNGTLILRNFQLQPFISDEKEFGDEVICLEDKKAKRHRRRRNSSVTIAVGSSLAIVSVVTVMGYAIFRYIKIKAVGYDTME